MCFQVDAVNCSGTSELTVCEANPIFYFSGQFFYVAHNFTWLTTNEK